MKNLSGANPAAWINKNTANENTEVSGGRDYTVIDEIARIDELLSELQGKYNTKSNKDLFDAMTSLELSKRSLVNVN